MDSLGISIAINIASSFIYDTVNSIFKLFSGNTIEENKLKKEINKYIDENLMEEFIPLTTSNIIESYLESPQIYDIIGEYFLTKNVNQQFSAGKNTVVSLNKILNDFAEEILELYELNTDLEKPEKTLVVNYLEFVYKCIENVLFLNLDVHDQRVVHFINSFTEAAFESVSELIANLDDRISILLRQKVKYDEDYENIKREYYDVFKKKNSEAHIYLLDKFPFSDFYVPPQLITSSKKDNNLRIILRNNKNTKETQRYNCVSWEFIFSKQNIIYITGGAGYGKSLFLKKIINDYEELGIYKSNEYLVIYGELKNFYLDKSQSPMSVTDFLLNSMRTSTLIDETKLSRDFLNHYLKMGRCIILLDALDEVDKTKREALHESIIAYFKSQNPNNKVCITSRDRGFIPDNDVEVFNIGPLDEQQIEQYVDKIIKLNKFELSEKENFMDQANVLVKKGFLNSFLVLSLLINIYKSEKELPENKLELYQKCFEYISNKREKEKSIGSFDWKTISPLMKDNTFIELALKCYPNNVSADSDDIKQTLLSIYTPKYGSEVATENAIDEFLRFCSDRTELFVPSAEENRFKFFHRSFFEYFYSQHIFLNVDKPLCILEEMKKFDVDSEVFELTVAMLKQKSESRYQDLMKLMIEESRKEFGENSKFTVFNILLLTMQVVDDVVYKRDFVFFLINNKDTILQNSEKFHNLHLVPNIFRNDIEICEQLCLAYEINATQKLLIGFFNLCKTLEEISNEKIPNLLDKVFVRQGNIGDFVKSETEKLPFYLNLFITLGKMEPLLDEINNYQINVLFNQNNKRTKKYVKYLNMYRGLNPKQRNTFAILLIHLSDWDHLVY